ncbi:TIGR02301 family protein [Mesorhizobium xinjiangense]|uniref:TIGR02301 family protein n=1 Tax=Mesorhizobium xinjiangense TaxID=2678685 RepID=UPI0012ECBB41|nr:TIGR02301 family protein [Mesorhizobium xinjiangense]
MAFDRVRSLLIALALIAAAPAPAAAIDAPFEARLTRLSEILGALHYLRNLCGEDSDRWREQIQALIAAENATGERRAKFIASFNRGYRAFSDSHLACTASTAEVIARYMKEGETLSHEIATVFGN